MKIIQHNHDNTVTFIDGDRTQTVPYDPDTIQQDAQTFFGLRIPEEQIPMYKIKKYLVLHKAATGVDLEAQIVAALNALPEPNRSLALIDWNHSPFFVPTSPLALGTKQALGMSDEDYVNLLVSAASLA